MLVLGAWCSVLRARSTPTPSTEHQALSTFAYTPLHANSGLIAPGVCALAVAYFLTAGQLEQRAIASQAPAVATGQALRHRVDRGLLMSDVRALASPALEGRRTSSPGGLRRDSRSSIGSKRSASPRLAHRAISRL